MARGRKPRTWVKIDCEGVLRGSINYLLSLEGQAIWIKMIALSEMSGGRPGYIEDNNHRGLPVEYIAHELHCTVETLREVLAAMEGDGAIVIDEDLSIHLVNFEVYQFGEYDRQRQYRENKAQDVTQKTIKEKTKYGQFENVLLTDDEHGKLVARFGAEGILERIERLSEGIESKGYKYKSHYATILTWDRMQQERSDNGKTGFRTNKQDTPRHTTTAELKKFDQ